MIFDSRVHTEKDSDLVLLIILKRMTDFRQRRNIVQCAASRSLAANLQVVLGE